AGIDRRENTAGGIAEIGNRVERDVRYGLAEHDVEDEEIVDRRARIADRAREHIRGLHGKTRAEQAVIERHVPDRDGASNGLLDHLADAEVFKEIAATGLRHMSPQIAVGPNRSSLCVRPALVLVARRRASAARERETTCPREFAIGRSIAVQLPLSCKSQAMSIEATHDQALTPAEPAGAGLHPPLGRLDPRANPRALVRH